MSTILDELNFGPFLLSFKLASITTLLLFFFALPLAWYLSQTKSRLKPLIESIVALPIVLPPSVLGFYLLVFFAPNSPAGEFINSLGGASLVFSFWGLVVASCIYSMPFMIQPLQSGFESLSRSMIEASYIGGKSSFQTLKNVALPNIKPALMTAFVITFAHTIGEFGVVLMIGGSIPGETKVASVAIYELVENMQYAKAHIYSLVMLILSFTVLLAVYIFNRKSKKNTL